MEVNEILKRQMEDMRKAVRKGGQVTDEDVGAVLAYARFEHAQCIASDDPRLKEK